ncbi:MAG: hypothetical protein ABI572_07235 [Actinomycetota bacterium]
MSPAARTHRNAMAGAIGPVGFLAVSFSMAVLRPDVIGAQGWASWPSSMAVGGPIGVGQIMAFLWLSGCYTAFALGALRPALGDPLAYGGFLAVAAGDVLLAFTTDGPGAGRSWHGTLHLAGVTLVTVATLVATAGVTRATRSRADWRVWRLFAWVPFAAGALGVVSVAEMGWAKVTYVLGISLPAAVAAWLVYRDAARVLEDEAAAT